ncbi:F-box domain-containing protein [Madurella fahalii]|uniref:F-box domain-containing protein n=1 Tax=Madurella fahalii TaxID=1157608 RepID=A0ABQ0GBW4_9PEZI
MASERPVTIDVLPPELLAQIFSFFDGPAPSDTRFHDQPEIDMLKNQETPLKDISLVNKRWRAIVLPILFRNVVWTLDRWDLPVAAPSETADPVDTIPMLAFLRANDLGRYVASFTMLVSNRMQPTSRRAEPRPAPGSSSGSSMETRAPWADPRLDLLFRSSQYPTNNSAAAYNEDNNWVWDMLFALVDPLRFTLIASPQMLASLLSCMLFLGDADSFSHRHLLHVLSLSRDARPKGARDGPNLGDKPPPRSPPSPIPAASRSCSSCGHEQIRTRSTLFTIRPWTHLLLNEGSSIRVYRNYEFFLRRPPSILGALLGCEEAPNDTPLIPPTVHSLSYIAIFPLSSHFGTLVSALPRVDRLFVQLVPRNEILRDPEEMRNVQASDLWMERNSCYGLVLRQLLSGGSFGSDDDEDEDDEDDDDDEGADSDLDADNDRLQDNWRYLREFESGDAADKEAWEMAVHYLNMSQTGWRVEREGVFVKGPKPGHTQGPGEGGGGGGGGGDGSSDDDGPATGSDALSVSPESFSPW